MRDMYEPGIDEDIESRIQTVLDETVRPAIRRDGGDIQLVKVDGHRVIVRLTGHCAHCPMSQMTLKQFVETTLRRCVDEQLVVEPE